MNILERTQNPNRFTCFLFNLTVLEFLDDPKDVNEEHWDLPKAPMEDWDLVFTPGSTETFSELTTYIWSKDTVLTPSSLTVLCICAPCRLFRVKTTPSASLSVVVILLTVKSSFSCVDLSLSRKKRLPLTQILQPFLHSSSVKFHTKIVKS